MADYIEREKLKQGIAEDALASLSYWDSGLMDILMLEIDECPAADVAPVVHGRWVPSEDDFDDDDVLFDVEEWCDWQCNACGEDICYDDPMPPRLLPRFCPNCGAKMDGRDET